MRAASKVKGFMMSDERCKELLDFEAGMEARGKNPARRQALSNARMLYGLEQGVDRAGRFRVRHLAPPPPSDPGGYGLGGLREMQSYEPGPEDQRRAALPGGDLAPAGRAAVVAMLRDEYTVLGLHATGEVHDGWRAKVLHVDSKPFY